MDQKRTNKSIKENGNKGQGMPHRFKYFQVKVTQLRFSLIIHSLPPSLPPPWK